MTNTFRDALQKLHTSIQLYTGQNPAAADVHPAELTRRLMDAMAASVAALAKPEPVAPTGEEAWQWYSYCPEDGIELHSSKELAHKAAQEIMGSYAKTAHSDGWHEDMESVSWGMLLPVDQAQVVERTEAEPDSEFDEWIRYELVPARWGTPTIQPVPVSERPWEREGWCDAEGNCYGWDGDYWWMVGNPGAADETITHCLPHHALPTPEAP
jgi:hypothetical protein